MEKIDEQLNNLSLVEVPTGVHQAVMHRVNYQRVKPILITSFILFVVNTIVMVWHMNSKLIDAEFLDMMHDFFDEFILSYSFVSTIVGSFFEIITPISFASLLLNLIGAIYVGKKITQYLKPNYIIETN